MNDMLKKAQQMQSDAETKQAELEEREYTAQSSGGMIEVTVTGKHQIRKLTIKPEAVDPDDIEKANELLYKENISSKDKQKLTFYFKRAKNMIEQYELIKQHEIVAMMRHFVRFYEFLLQVSCFEDTDLHKSTTSSLICWLISISNIRAVVITSTARSKLPTSCRRKPKNTRPRIW